MRTELKFSPLLGFVVDWGGLPLNMWALLLGLSQDT